MRKFKPTTAKYLPQSPLSVSQRFRKVSLCGLLPSLVVQAKTDKVIRHWSSVI